MIILDTTSKSLQLVLNSSPAVELDWVVSYVVLTSSSYTASSSDGVSNGTNPVTLVAAPSASAQHQIKHINVTNTNTTSVHVTIRVLETATARKVCAVTLEPMDTLQYADGEGFSVLSFTSGYKSSAAKILVLAVDSVTRSSGILSFSNSNNSHSANISFGMTGTNASISISGGGNVSVTGSLSRYITDFAFECPRQQFATNYAAATNSAAINLSMQRFIVSYDFEATRLDFLANISVGGSRAASWTIFAGVYGRTTGGSVSLLSSQSAAITFTSGGATNNSSVYLGNSNMRVRSFSVGTWSFTPGDYWLGVINSNSTNQSAVTVSYAGASSLQLLPLEGLSYDTAGNAGLYSAATGSFPATIELQSGIIYGHTGVTNQTVNRQPYFRMYGTFS